MDQYIIAQPVLHAMIFAMQDEPNHFEEDLAYEEGLSECCGALVLKDLRLCSDCRQHCEIVDYE